MDWAFLWAASKCACLGNPNFSCLFTDQKKKRERERILWSRTDLQITTYLEHISLVYIWLVELFVFIVCVLLWGETTISGWLLFCIYMQKKRQRKLSNWGPRSWGLEYALSLVFLSKFLKLWVRQPGPWALGLALPVFSILCSRLLPCLISF